MSESSKYLDSIVDVYDTNWPILYPKLQKLRFDYVSKYIESSDDVLDFGIGAGEILDLMSKHSRCKSLTVVEGSKLLFDRACTKYKTDIEDGWLILEHSMFEDFAPGKLYDKIICSHVLEHMEDPIGLAEKMSSLLESKGVCVVIVPNALSLHRLMGVELGMLRTPYSLNDHDIAVGHKKVYDLRDLERDLKQGGLTITKDDGLFAHQLSNSQIEDSWSEDMVNASFRLGSRIPEYASEIVVVCRKSS